MKSSTFNLIKACVGSGVLSLPAGVAAFGDVPSAIVPASILMGLLGTMSAYSFYIIGKLCSETKASSISEAWGKTVGEVSWRDGWLERSDSKSTIPPSYITNNPSRARFAHPPVLHVAYLPCMFPDPPRCCPKLQHNPWRHLHRPSLNDRYQPISQGLNRGHVILRPLPPLLPKVPRLPCPSKHPRRRRYNHNGGVHGTKGVRNGIR